MRFTAETQRRRGWFMLIILLPLFLFFITNCNRQGARKSAETDSEKVVSVTVPSFNADSAYRYIKEQLLFGPRVVNTPAHERCAGYLEKKLRSWCTGVSVQKGTVAAFNGTPLKFTNIIGSFHPGTKNRILLLAHWDSRPWADQDPDPKNRTKPIDGANDGASGVGVLLEIARILGQDSARGIAIGVDILFCDAEDYGPPQDVHTGTDTEDYWGLGSQYWAKNPHQPDYFARYGILLDMVGAKNATFLMEGISMSYAPEVVKNIWTTGGQAGYPNYFLFEQGTYITDDHLYINKYRNIPTINIIHLDKTSRTGFFPHWHTMKDNIDCIDPNTLKAVGQTLLTVIYNER